MSRKFLLALALSLCLLWPVLVAEEKTQAPDLELFFQAASRNEDEAEEALEKIASEWKDNYSIMILDLIRVVQGRRDSTPQRLIRFLRRQTDQSFGGDLQAWWEWAWSLPDDLHPHYALFKGLLYANIDPRMREFFPPGVKSIIRLDEIDWGGVPVNGIPPLDHPEVVSVDEADYLDDGNVVFGLALNGEARAYPKRIAAWHEMVRDRLGGVELTIVYCTLCGTVIPYESQVGGQLRRFGTSGLLYRSNKLMFDEESMSLWSALEGKPVVGELVGTGLKLKRHPIVTTTWEEWRERHPETTVLSLETGHERDYSEGAAYRDYFATDRLMFTVSQKDDRLNNKDEVLVMLLEPASDAGEEKVPVAISAAFLENRPVYHLQAAGQDLVVITSPQGANRVYEANDQRFARRIGDDRVQDVQGRTWRVTEEALVLQDDPQQRMPRRPAQRAFWFGWYAQFPQTTLIK